MHKNYTGLLYISSVAWFCTNAFCFDGHSRSISHKNQSAVLLKAIISGTVRFLPMAIPCTLTYPSRSNLPLISPNLPLGPRNLPLKTLRQRKVKLYQFRSFDFHLNVVFDTKWIGRLWVIMPRNGLISRAFTVPPVHPVGLWKLFFFMKFSIKACCKAATYPSLFSCRGKIKKCTEK